MPINFSVILSSLFCNILFNHVNFANAACKIIDSNFFTYITTNRYLSDKFNKIKIDTSASNHSIAGYGQFMAYTRDFKYMTIDISKVDIIHVEFGIDLILSIKSVFI